MVYLLGTIFSCEFVTGSKYTTIPGHCNFAQTAVYSALFLAAHKYINEYVGLTHDKLHCPSVGKERSGVTLCF